MRRLPQIAFGLLAMATIGAFFLVQSLKTASPLVWAAPHPVPAVIDPVHRRACQPPPFKGTQITISVSHPYTVGIYIVSADNPSGGAVATVSGGTPMRAGKQHEYPKTFTWNGLLSDGQAASAGDYYFRIVLEGQGRSANINQYPVHVITQSPRVRVLSVRVLGSRPVNGTTTAATTTATTAPATATTGRSGTDLVPVASPAVISPPHGDGVRIAYTPGKYRVVETDIYRTDVAGRPELVDSLTVNHPDRGSTTWNGEIYGEPAPAGTYLIGITAEDLACNKAQWPTVPVASGDTAGAGVTVRYLSVTPPLTPTASGADAAVTVDSASSPFHWSLRRSASSKVLSQGDGASGLSTIEVRMPRRESGLYTLRVTAGTQSAVVPLVASQVGSAAAHARVLVVLPMLTWMGDTPVDDSGDGLPDTLKSGNAVSLKRPLVDGPPANFGADAELLSYLRAHHFSYQLTTDVALAQDVGPSLADRGGVVFPEGENFLPAGLELTLRGFVRGGGRALVLGTGALSAISHISGYPTAPRASVPRATPTDPFGARRGQLTPTGGELISSVGDDALGLFNNAGEYAGFSQYQPIRPPRAAAGSVSTVGIGRATPAIVGFHYGSGTVIEVGLSGFAASLTSNADASSLLNNVWALLSQ